jgi:ATP-dependent DNA helicase RecG
VGRSRSIKAEEQLGEPGSETRNPRVAAVLHEVNVAETKGSGIRAMRELMQAHDLLPPTFESSRRPDQFVATFLFHHFLGQEDLSWLRGLTTEPLSDEEARALVVVRELGAIDNAAYRNVNRTDTLNASVHLRRLRDLGLLAMKGSGSRTYYVPGPGFRPTPSLPTDPPQPGWQTPQGNRQTPQPDTQTPQAGQQTSQPDTPLPADLAQRLPEPGTRPERATLQQLVLDLCTWKPHSARELASLLGRRDHKHLVKELLSPMVAQGLLAFTIPSMEKHPEQRYTARTPAPPPP